MTHISCPNLDNNLCLWLGNRYDPASRCLVIPARGRIKLDEALVFCTMGLPRGPLEVPYRIDQDIEPKLFSYLYRFATVWLDTMCWQPQLGRMGMKVEGAGKKRLFPIGWPTLVSGLGTAYT